MESASLLSRESTTLSFANPQKGHFMGLIAELVIVTGWSEHDAHAMCFLCVLRSGSSRPPRFRASRSSRSHRNQLLPLPPPRSPPPLSAATTARDERTVTPLERSPQNSPATAGSRNSPPLPAAPRRLCPALQWSPAARRHPLPAVAASIPPCSNPSTATPWSRSSPASARRRRG